MPPTPKVLCHSHLHVAISLVQIDSPFYVRVQHGICKGVDFVSSLFLKPRRKLCAESQASKHVPLPTQLMTTPRGVYAWVMF